MDKKINICNIIATMGNIRPTSGDIVPVLDKMVEAREKLEEVLQDLDNLPVKGKEMLDMHLGCILAIEQIIGDTENKGE